VRRGGEIALLRSSPRNATIHTLSPSVFITLTRGQFDALLDRAPLLRFRRRRRPSATP